MGSRYDGTKGPPDIEGMTSLKVDNLTYRTTMEDLERYFRKYGEIGDIYIPRDRSTHESRGFAFVRFHERRDADDAMDGMDGKVIDGREVRVALARYGRPTTQHNPRGGSSKSYRDRDRDRDGYGSRRRHSPRRRSRSRSNSPPRRRSRSRTRSPPRYHNRSASKSKSPIAARTSRSPQPARTSRSPQRSVSRSRSRSRSRSGARF